MDNLSVTVAGGGFEQLAPMIILQEPVLFPYSPANCFVLEQMPCYKQLVNGQRSYCICRYLPVSKSYHQHMLCAFSPQKLL